MAAHSMTIGRLAAAAGVHVETVRYYQRRGLLRAPSRAAGSVRRYEAEDVGRLRFIRRAQGMGFSLAEVSELLEIQGHAACEQTRQLADRKLMEVRSRLQQLKRLESDLVSMVERCGRVEVGGACPMLDVFFALADRDHATALSRAE